MPDALPKVIPIFPLPGVILLPRTMLPLHIFEPRYRAMTADALAGDGVIGMIQPTNAEGLEGNPEIYQTGCAGKIIEHQQLEDGRYMVTLEGLIRFRVKRELETSNEPYRIVEADYSTYQDDLEGEKQILADREKLANAIREHLRSLAANVDLSRIDRLNDEQLVNGGSMLIPFVIPEKQALLEAPNLEQRANILRTLLQMDDAETGSITLQ